MSTEITPYSILIRPLLFQLDPEIAHHLAIRAAFRLGWAMGAMRATLAITDERLATQVDGLNFPAPAPSFFCLSMIFSENRSPFFGSRSIVPRRAF
jgi:hypothetical protein